MCVRHGGFICAAAERFNFLHLMRRDAFPKGKLMDLPESQRQELRAWLVDEKLTYAQAAQRIHERWGIKVSQTTISTFYGRFCNHVPRGSEEQTVLVDVRINRESDGVRVRVIGRSPGVRVFASGEEIKYNGSLPLKRSQTEAGSE